MDQPLPLISGRLAWWLTAWLRGLVGADDLLDGVSPEGEIHHVVGLTDPDTELISLSLALGAVRRSGATAAGVALPVPGDPAGLGGPAALTEAANEAGEAVILVGAGLALVPHAAGRGVVWQAHPARPRMLTDLGQASRDLRLALVEAATTLADLEVAKWRPDVADELMDLRRPRTWAAPPGTPPDAAGLAARATQAERIVELALEDDGGAVSLSEIERRRAALQPLDRAARHALVAACSPEVWPPAPPGAARR